MKTDRPVIRCIIAKPIYGTLGEVERTQVVTLQKAYYAKEAGWYVIGPDPADEDAAAAWDREHAVFTNHPGIDP